MKRVLVIGSGGAGKSTFARRLGERLGLPVIHLDVCFWRPGWVETPKEEWRQTVEGLCARESWVMDGNFSGTLELRLAACDTVIFLDLPRAVCVWRALKRWLMYRDARRPDMAEGCGEKFDLKFLDWIWNYPSRSRPKVLARIEEHARDKQVITLRSSDEVEKFLTEVG
ncbi:MAG TPA: DNA topology modulation protein [Pyrinomonadaceae bacterium]